MTYAELAEKLGIKEPSAKRLVRRHRAWRRQADNQGSVRIFVPLEAIKAREDVRNDVRDDIREGIRRDIPAVMTALDEVIRGLTARAERAEAEVAKLTDALRLEHERAEVAERVIQIERKRADDLRVLAGEAAEARQAAQDELVRLRRDEAERREEGLLRRFGRAWRGE
jgi:dynactin complex subunit